MSFSSLPSELRREILRQTNSATLRSLHHAQAGTRSKITTLTNAKLHLAYRRKLTAKVEDVYRVRLRKAFGTALAALRYDLTNMQKLSTKQGWHDDGSGIMTKTTADGYIIRRSPVSVHSPKGYVDIVSPRGPIWRIRKLFWAEPGFGVKNDIYYIFDDGPIDAVGRIEIKISKKMLDREFGLDAFRYPIA